MADLLTLAQARALWWQRQGLEGGRGSEPLATVIGESGWLRTLGGADVYLAARARRPGLARRELDAAVAGGALRVVPAVRGCIYAVPAGAVGDLLAINAEAWRRSTEQDLAKIGRKLRDVEVLADPVLAVLDRPMATDAVRKALPAGSIPSFGDAGKKVGLSSPLPLVLRLLELAGRIERTLEDGKLDTERYLWRKAEWRVPPAASDHASRLANVVGAFLRFAGPATLGHIAKWSGLAQRELKPVLERLGAAQVTVDGLGEAWLHRADLAASRQPAPPSGIALLAFEDNYLVNHGALGAVTAPEHHDVQLDIWGGTKPEPIGKAEHVLTRTIVIDGLIAGFWEVDPRSSGAVWHTFVPAPKALAAELDERTADTARFLFDQLGHARSFTLDSMDSVQQRADRIAALRKNGRAKPAPKPTKPAAKAAKPAPKATKPAPKAAKPKPAAKKAKPASRR